MAVGVGGISDANGVTVEVGVCFAEELDVVVEIDGDGIQALTPMIRIVTREQTVRRFIF